MQNEKPRNERKIVLKTPFHDKMGLPVYGMSMHVFYVFYFFQIFGWEPINLLLVSGLKVEFIPHSMFLVDQLFTLILKMPIRNDLGIFLSLFKN